MRKRLKLKKHSCAMCKPHKMKWSNRWTPKQLAELKESERACREAAMM